jgi:2-methylcitrate dehydratase PrpD
MIIPPSTVRPQPDKVLLDIADYVANYRVESAEAYDTARLCLMDTLGCSDLLGCR